MKRRILIVLSVLLIALVATPVLAYALPEGFVYVTDVIETAQLDIRYYSGYNFVGTRINGTTLPRPS